MIEASKARELRTAAKALNQSVRLEDIGSCKKMGQAEAQKKAQKMKG